MSSFTAKSLSQFLVANRTKYLEALKEGKGQAWTLVTGNEAGDLDSAASSIAYSYLASTLHGQPTVPLLQTSRADLQLRAENLYAYEMARLDSSQQDLLCIDDIPAENLPHLSSSPFALVDHNRLTSRFSDSSQFPQTPRVVALIDHHIDEGCHKDANPRLVTEPVGSCSSLVTQYFMESWSRAEPPPPQELATLLLCAIFIDTNGLRPGGKAVPIDHDAANFLLPNSTLTSLPHEISTTSQRDEGGVFRVIQTLNERKQAVSHLSSRDLLRRDYKEYLFQSSSHSTLHTTIGLATVPLSPKTWFRKDASPKLWESMDAWMDERGLDALGILCTYTSLKGKHKRQELWVVRRGSESLRETLWKGLEAHRPLELERRNMVKQYMSGGVEVEANGDIRTPQGGVARLWRQGNAKATRKVIAPLVKELIERM